MSDYNEHLITQAGGDGDRLAAIEARIPQIPESEMSNTEKDRAYLLAMVREQAAKLEAAHDIAEWIRDNHGDYISRETEERLRAALGATK